jgi:hypothetical protein
LSGGTNVYAYAGGDPENFVDPTGASPLLAGVLVGAAEGALLGYVDEAAAQALDPDRSGYDCDAIARAAAAGAAAGAAGGAFGGAFGGAGGGGGEWATEGEGAGGCAGGLCEAGNCFVAGTPVQTAEGERPIESLRAGDEVWAEDPETGEIALHEIARTFARDATDVLTVDIAEETASASRIEHVRVTPEHRWWTADRGWTESRALREGEPLGTQHEGRAWSVAIHPPPATETARSEHVFNIEVEAAHSYFVGHGALWVHNTCVDPPATFIGQEKGPSVAVPGGAAGPIPAMSGKGVQYRGGEGERA